DLGDDLQFEPERPLLARLAGGGVARGLVDGGLEVVVAEPAPPAAGDDHGFARADVGQQLARFPVVDRRARGDAGDAVGGVGAAAVLGAARLAGLGRPLVGAAEVD